VVDAKDRLLAQWREEAQLVRLGPRTALRPHPPRTAACCAPAGGCRSPSHLMFPPPCRLRPLACPPHPQLASKLEEAVEAHREELADRDAALDELEAAAAEAEVRAPGGAAGC
jgi:hypothetical protein